MYNSKIYSIYLDTLMIKHITLDAWNTLLVPNATFAKLRTEFLSDHLRLPLEKVKGTYTEVKNCIDNYTEEQSDFAPENRTCYVILLNNLGFHASSEIEAWNVGHIIEVIQKLFIANPPSIPDELIYALQQPYEVTWSVISNTNFVTGTIINEVIKSHIGYQNTANIRNFYSDIEKHSKPSPYMFEQTILALNNGVRTVERGQVVHIGDNMNCDVKGAVLAGFNASLVISPTQTAKKIQSIVY